MLVYRVEHPLTHEGPYKHLSIRSEHTDITAKMVRKHNNDIANHPTPHNDGLRMQNPDAYHCGFATLHAMRRWFDGYLDELHRIGFVLAELEVLDSGVFSGRKQVIFRPRDILNRTIHPLIGGTI